MHLRGQDMHTCIDHFWIRGPQFFFANILKDPRVSGLYLIEVCIFSIGFLLLRSKKKCPTWKTAEHRQFSKRSKRPTILQIPSSGGCQSMSPPPAGFAHRVRKEWLVLELFFLSIRDYQLLWCWAFSKQKLTGLISIVCSIRLWCCNYI